MERVVIMAFNGVQSLDVAGPAEVFSTATQLLRADRPGAPDQGYDVSIVSTGGGTVSTESAVRLHTDAAEHILEAGDEIGTLVVPGGLAVQELQHDAQLTGALAALAAQSRRLVTVCSGTYLAAATGALDGHRVTTHWARSNRLADTHPQLEVDPDPIFIHSSGDGSGHPDVWSSAGVTAGIDLCLAIVEHDHSTDLAQTAAQWLVMFLRRPGGQSQFASPTWLRQAPPGPIQQAQTLVIDDPGADHRVESIARRVGMSERHFVRKFSAEVGVSPAQFVAQVRVDAARHELEQSTDTVEAIARRCGFGSSETMRRTLIRHLGVSPHAYRQRFTHHVTGIPNQQKAHS